MKILIADDEKKIRLTLISMLKELNTDCGQIVEVDNGEKLLQTLDGFSPDIAFVDIKMPKMSGLDAIKEAKKRSPLTKWIIFSGFQEFEFAQQAIELGVSKYMLKPVSKQALADVMAMFQEEDRLVRSDLKKKFERDVIALYHDRTAVSASGYEKIIRTGIIESAVLFLDGKVGTEAFRQAQKRLEEDLTALIEERFKPNAQIAHFVISTYEYALICAYDPDPKDEYKEETGATWRALEALVAGCRRQGFAATLIRRGQQTRGAGISESITSILKHGSLRILRGLGTPWKITEQAPGKMTAAVQREIADAAAELGRAFREGKEVSASIAISQLEHLHSQYQRQWEPAVTENLSVYFSCVVFPEEKRCTDMKKLLDALRGLLQESFAERKNHVDYYVDQLIEYVDHNYMNNIGLSTIANELQITPNYLGNLFFKKTNLRFSSYLTLVRISKAKELLKQTGLSINKIAEKVGYHNPRYFSKQFYQLERQLPSDYRKGAKE